MDTREDWEKDNPLVQWCRSQKPPLSLWDVFNRTGISYRELGLMTQGAVPSNQQFKELIKLTGDQDLEAKWADWRRKEPRSHPSVQAP